MNYQADYSNETRLIQRKSYSATDLCTEAFGGEEQSFCDSFIVPIMGTEPFEFSSEERNEEFDFDLQV